MELLVITILGLGFFTTVVAIVAIVYGKDDVAKLAIKVHGQIVKILSSKDS
jgi:uncharacterized membrane protein